MSTFNFFFSSESEEETQFSDIFSLFFRQLYKRMDQMDATVNSLKADLTTFKNDVSNEAQEVSDKLQSLQNQIKALQDQIAQNVPVTQADLNDLSASIQEADNQVKGIVTPEASPMAIPTPASTEPVPEEVTQAQAKNLRT